MTTEFEQGSNYVSIIDDESGKSITFSCFEDGRHEICFEQANYRDGVAADVKDWEMFFSQCEKLTKKFKK